MSFSNFAILASLFLIFQSSLLTVLVICWYSSLHWFFLARSAAPSSFRVWIILSIAPMTSSKCPALEVRISTARAAKRMLWDFLTWAFNAL